MAVGLSTGLCGALTTFGTWMQNTAVMILNGNSWTALIDVICQLAICQWAFNFGHYVAGCGMVATMRGDIFVGHGQLPSKDQYVAAREASDADNAATLTDEGPEAPSPMAQMIAYDLELDDLSSWSDIRQVSKAEMSAEERRQHHQAQVLGRAVFIAEI